ncbi:MULTISPECIES: hypothetical protein [Methylosinus]|uniref:hypothetical protein n=1 Tax=Methylosinus TaxID=425 RepID=UPI001FCC2B87|nr:MULTISPECIES: hypothetical protein [Methylosinus]
MSDAPEQNDAAFPAELLLQLAKSFRRRRRIIVAVPVPRRDLEIFMSVIAPFDEAFDQSDKAF